MTMKETVNLLDIDTKVNFNDIVMREMGLDIDENDHLYDMETEYLYKVKEKFIRYSEEEYPILYNNEIDMNLIENPKLMEILFGLWIEKWGKRNNYKITSFSQISLKGSKNGFFNITYVNNKGEIKEIKSNIFINESLRIFNLICILNHRPKMYDFSRFNIEIIRKDKNGNGK